MAKISVLADTDIFIDCFNTTRFHALFDPNRFTVSYSIITKGSLTKTHVVLPQLATAAVLCVDEDLRALLPIES